MRVKDTEERISLINGSTVVIYKLGKMATVLVCFTFFTFQCLNFKQPII